MRTTRTDPTLTAICATSESLTFQVEGCNPLTLPRDAITTRLKSNLDSGEQSLEVLQRVEGKVVAIHAFHLDPDTPEGRAIFERFGVKPMTFEAPPLPDNWAAFGFSPRPSSVEDKP